MAVINLEFSSANVMKTVHVQVLIPNGESALNVEPPYKTVYFLPGFSSNASDIISLSDIRSIAWMHGIAVVMPDGDNSFYVDQGPMNNYSAFIAELVTVTRKLFHLSEKREDTYLAGMSMGGFGALYNGMHSCDTFSKIALLAPAFDIYDIKVPGTDLNMFAPEFLNRAFGSKENYSNTDLNYEILIDQALKNNENLPALFTSCGDTDPLVGTVNKKFNTFLTDKGINYTFTEVPGGHDMVFLANILPHVFDFLKG